jgi:hypothetical protein
MSETHSPGLHVAVFLNEHPELYRPGALRLLMPGLLGQVRDIYTGLILHDTLDVLDTEPAQPNINWHLASREVLRYTASTGRFSSLTVGEWEARFASARKEHAARYGRPSIHWMVVGTGQWGDPN